MAVPAFAGAGARGHRARDVLSHDPERLVPEHWHVEVFSAPRGLVAGRHLDDAAAVRGLDRARNAQVNEVRIRELLARRWALRHSFSAYDAPYVVLACERDATLVTGDGKLARAALAHCRVELV